MNRQLMFYVEGRTEREFARKVLFPHLADKGIVCLGPMLAINNVRKGRMARGGVRSYAPVKKSIENLLKQRGSRDFRLTTMLDLYGLPSDFPGKLEIATTATGAAKADAIAAAWAADIADPRFVPFVLSHEFEALVLSDPDSLLAVYPEAQKAVTALKKTIAGFNNPEDIDDSPHTAPSKRIFQCLPYYNKAAAGPSAIAEIGLDKVRRRCSHFNGWLIKLENL